MAELLGFYVGFVIDPLAWLVAFACSLAVKSWRGALLIVMPIFVAAHSALLFFINQSSGLEADLKVLVLRALAAATMVAGGFAVVRLMRGAGRPAQ